MEKKSGRYAKCNFNFLSFKTFLFNGVDNQSTFYKAFLNNSDINCL